MALIEIDKANFHKHHPLARRICEESYFVLDYYVLAHNIRGRNEFEIPPKPMVGEGGKKTLYINQARTNQILAWCLVSPLDRGIKIDYIESFEKGWRWGEKLISHLKEKYSRIELFSLPEAEGFYSKLGFKPNDEFSEENLPKYVWEK